MIGFGLIAGMSGCTAFLGLAWFGKEGAVLGAMIGLIMGYIATFRDRE